MEIKLMYITDGGFEWLEETININEFNYMKSIDEYVARNQAKAEKLEDKWQLDGEDVNLTLYLEPQYPISDKELLLKAVRYVDEF